MNEQKTASVFNRQVYLIAAVASLALSFWGAWAEFIPNPDGGLYLRSAELFADGRWAAGVKTYDWPAYSIAIAGVITLTGLEAFLAAQLVNALSAVVTTITYIALAGRLSNGDQLVVVCAAIVILLQPQLVHLRPVIIRDTTYFAFLLLTLYFVACDFASPRLATKLAIVASIILAGLFRIEGFALAALVLIYYLAQRMENWRRSSVVLAIIAAAIAAAILVILGLGLWTSGALGKLFAGQFRLDELTPHLWPRFVQKVAERLHTLRYEFLYPHGGADRAIGAYIGITLGLVTVSIVQAMKIPLAVLTVFAFYPKRIMPRPVNVFVLWFTLGQLPLLIVFTFAALLLDRRYAGAITLVLSIALAFLLAEATRQWQLQSAKRVLLPVMAVVLLASWAVSIPRPSKLAYLKESGQWIGRELPIKSNILTNDIRIAYYSGRPYTDPSGVWIYGYNSNPAEDSKFDYFAFKTKDANSLPAPIKDIPNKELVRSFAGKDGDTVLVYARKSVVK